MNVNSKIREHERRLKAQERRKKHRKGKAAARSRTLPPATLHIVDGR
jgi:hypothetical protein